jgi:hypothetical protein
VQALGLKIQGNKNEQLNQVNFGLKQKNKAIAARTVGGSGNILQGLFNQGVGSVRQAAAPGIAAVKNAGERVMASDVVVGTEVGAKAAWHGLKVGGKKVVQGVKDIPIWAQLYGAAAVQAIKGAGQKAKASIVNAARQESLSTNAQNRLLGQ